MHPESYAETPVNQPGSDASRPPDHGQADSEPAFGLSWMFILFAVLVIGAAAVAGSVRSGKLNLNQYFSVPKPAAQAHPVQAAQVARPGEPAHTAQASTASKAIRGALVIPPAPLKPNTFVVTSISLGEPSFAIINGRSLIVGDPVAAPGVTGWKVSRIVDGAVLLQNGSTFTSLPLSLPGIKPLDDQLHPLN